MATFIQIHALKSYPAANLNRDDAGRPKTMFFGGAERLRVSSQSLKRAWRESAEFRAAAGEINIGARTQEFAYGLRDLLLEKGVSEKDAIDRIREVIEHDKLGKLEDRAKTKGKSKSKNADSAEDDADDAAAPIEPNQLVHLGRDEIAALDALAERLAKGDEIKEKEALILQRHPKAVDIALFGRMLADNRAFNVEAAAQVAHAFTTHRASVEDDFYTAVDDLKKQRPGADAGAGFMGIFEFGTGVFYQYLNINADLLIENLGGDVSLARQAVSGLVEAVAIANPTGKQNSTAALPRAGYLLVERGSHAPRTLADAFLRPVKTHDSDDSLLNASVSALQKHRNDIDQAYGRCVDAEVFMHVGNGGTCAECVAFAADSIIGS